MQFVYGGRNEEFDAVLLESLKPRSQDCLLELALPLLSPESRLLDIGCRDARHLIPLVERSGCTGVGIDPVDGNIARAKAAVSAAGLDDRIEIRHGVMERSGEPDTSVDVIWCRDVITVVPDLAAGFAEAARVLKPGGAAVIYSVFKTARLEPREAAALRPLGNVDENLERSRVERAFHQAGFQVELWEDIATEFREYDEERTKPISDDLLRLARLRRRREEIVRRFGQQKYDLAEASLHWLAYLMLGKFEPAAYVLRLP
jgi:SAM-dependent methyltransferase